MDDNKAIRFGIVLGLISLFSFGAYVVMKSFKSADPVAVNNDPVDFSEPAKKLTRGKRTPASAPSPAGRPPAAARSYGDSGSGSNYESPRVDGSTDGGSSAGSFFTPEGQDVVPLDTANNANSGSSGGDSSSDRSPSSTDSAAGSGGSSSSGIFGGLGNLFGSSGDGTSTGRLGSSTGGGGGGGGPTPTPAPAPTGISAGTTGGGAFVGQTQNGFKASVSIGVPLSGVSGTTSGGGNYRYQVNLSGQQSQ